MRAGRARLPRSSPVTLTTSLKGLHDVIQAVMPFEAHHLFEFNAGGKRYAVPDPEWDFGGDLCRPQCPDRRSVDRGITTFTYTCDFGDD